LQVRCVRKSAFPPASSPVLPVERAMTESPADEAHRAAMADEAA
jgi:hypothetical protein